MAGQGSTSLPHGHPQAAERHPPSSPLARFDVGDAFAAQADSPFFASFPAEIRTKILVAAFGGRVLHVVHWRNFRTGQLQWSGGECKDGLAVHMKPASLGCLAECSCIGDLHVNQNRKKKTLRVHAGRVGVVGWLTSCRMAFAEGIDVLYGGNTIAFRCETLKLDTSHYLPAQYLSRLTSITWVLGYAPSGGAWITGPGDIKGADQLALLERLLHAISATMPSLRRLYLGFCEDISFWDESLRHFKRRFQLYTRDVIPLLDQTARTLCRSDVDIEFGMPRSVSGAHWEIGRASGLRFQGPYYPSSWEAHQVSHRGQYHIRNRVWRPVMDVAEEGLEKAETRTPALTDDYGAGRGYWISATDNDLPIHFMEDDEYSHLRPGDGFDSAVALVQAWNSPCDEVLKCVNLSLCECARLY